jgi:tRNA threonylcarbamoyladenosine biosynthesis protein TsaE
VNETEALGRLLGRLVEPGDVIVLVGDLGTGKTCLTRGIARGLGILEPITSPTFVLIAEYPSRYGFPLYHADCYRLDNALAEAQDIGLEEILTDNGVCVIEWAERIEALLPPDYLRIDLQTEQNDDRVLTFQQSGVRSRQILDRLTHRLSLVTHDPETGNR